MFVRKKINSSGSISVQILEKTNRTNKLIQTVGSSKDEIEIERLYNRAFEIIYQLKQQSRFNFYSNQDTYPLCDKGSNKAKNEIWVQDIIKDILETELSLKDIAKKWNKSYATVKNINSGRSHKKEKYKYPLRDNK